MKSSAMERRPDSFGIFEHRQTFQDRKIKTQSELA